MANHCIDCGICGDDLRSGVAGTCNWEGCPGWVQGPGADLDKIAAEHPNHDIRKVASAKAEALAEMQVKLQHLKKVRELASHMERAVVDTAARLYDSGGVDPKSFGAEEYALAKILLSAAIKQHASDYKPLHKEHLDEVDNLVRF